VKRFFLGSFLHLPKAMWVLFVIQVLLRGGDFVFPFLTLFLTRKLGLSSAQAGLWVMANVVSGLLGTMVAGKVSDHLGRRNVLGACMAGSALLTALCGFLPPSLLIAQVLVVAGFFQGSMKPIIAAAIMDLCPSEQRKEAFSLSYLGVNLGVAIGPMAAGFLFEHHMTWMFFGNGVTFTLALILLLRSIPVLGQGAPGDLPASERAVEGSALRAFLARPLLVAFCVIALFVSFSYAQTNFGLTLYASEVFGARGANVFGFLMSLNAVVVLASTAFMTRLTQRLSSPAAMALGTALYTLGFALLVFRLSFGLLAFSTIVWTLGEVLLAINFGAYLASHTPANLRGRFQSFRETLSSAGRIFSPVACGLVITHWGIHASWALTALVTLGCTGGFVWLHRWEERILASSLPVNAGEKP
jgi:MFS family permease